MLQAVELAAGGDVEAAAVQLADLVVLHIEALGVVKVRHREAVGTCGQDRGAAGRAMDGCCPWGPTVGGHGEAGLGMEVLPSHTSRGWGAAPGCNSWHQVPGKNGTNPPAPAMPHHHSLQLPSACTAVLIRVIFPKYQLQEKGTAAIPWDVPARGQEQAEPGWGELLTNNSSVSQRGAKGLLGPIPSCTNPSIGITSGAWLCSAHMRTMWCCWCHRFMLWGRFLLLLEEAASIRIKQIVLSSRHKNRKEHQGLFPKAHLEPN